ncbi:MAG: MBL fold metallo-hydrolase [Geodermatophilaceae bacterium]|nr:MBL fold metallo-hydrolase [Geodermatophilaceae bacterium]
MLVTGFPAGVFATNCYVLAPGPGTECVVIDPGQDSEQPLQSMLAEHRLKPVAVVLTHGHLDHVWSVVPVCDGYDIPAYIHPDDRAMLADPLSWHGEAIAAMIRGLTFSEPAEVVELTDGLELTLAGVTLTVRKAPGHTRGSVVFELDHPEAPVLLSGDLLFAGSIGRTDLPGGSYEQILDSLARVCSGLADETVVLSGHGPQTTIGRERATNPYLREAASAAARPRRGL